MDSRGFVEKTKYNVCLPSTKTVFFALLLYWSTLSFRKVVRRSDYLPGGDNLSLSSACKDSVKEFNDRTSRSWFAEAKNPFAHMKFTHSPSVMRRSKHPELVTRCCSSARDRSAQVVARALISIAVTVCGRVFPTSFYLLP